MNNKEARRMLACRRASFAIHVRGERRDSAEMSKAHFETECGSLNHSQPHNPVRHATIVSMNSFLRNKWKRHLMALDLCVLIFSTIFALITRYVIIGSPFVPWQVNLYTTLFLVELMLYVLIFLYRYNVKRVNMVHEQDPADNLVNVLKNQILLAVFLMMFLVATQNAQRVSRLWMVFLFLYNFVFDFAVRMWYRARLIRKNKGRGISHWVLVVTDSTHEALVLRRLQAGLPATTGIRGIWVTDAADTQEQTGEGIPCFHSPGEILKLSADQVATEILIDLPGSDSDTVQKIADAFAGSPFDVVIGLNDHGSAVSRDRTAEIGRRLGVLLPSLYERCDVCGTHYCISSVDSSVDYVKRHAADLSGRYVCFSNVHTTMMAKDDPAFREVLNHAALTFPDGNPIAAVMRRHGWLNAQRIGGPDFMEAMFRATMDGSVTHYFYGSTPETIRKLKDNLEAKYPGIIIKGLYSPPFRPLTREEDETVTQMVNNAGADLIWIGLGAPKQEKWMAGHEGRIHGVMLGVGAGFNFHAGTVKRAPKWMQKVSLEWLYRLLQDPKHLFTRYLVTNAKFLWFVLKDRFQMEFEDGRRKTDT